MKKLQPILLASALCGATLVSAQTIDNLHFGPQKEASGQRLDGISVIVGDDVITRKEYQSLGNNKLALDSLIIRKLLIQEAKKNNITIGDTALNTAVEEQEKQGKYLSREVLREKLMIQKLQRQVASSLVNISAQEISDGVDKQLKNMDRSFQLVDLLVPVPEGSNAKTLRKAEEKTQRLLVALKTRDGQSVAAEFGAVYNDLGLVQLSKIPAAFSKRLLDAPTGKYLKPIIDSDGVHILKIIGKQPGMDVGVAIQETRVSHILIRDKDNANAQEIIDDIYNQLQSGADFSTLAIQSSQDFGSAPNGGSLGWTAPRKMVPVFEAVMDSTEIGNISQPFKSPFGYHILQVHERRETSVSSRKALEQKTRKILFQKKASEEWDLWLTRLREEANVEILEKP